MLYLEDEKEVRLFKITGMKGTKIEKALKSILKEYDNIVSWEIHDIENCWIIKHSIRLLDKTLVVGKQGHQSSRKHK